VLHFLNELIKLFLTWVYFQTAPNGASVLQTITTPTFITVFVEQVPGALAWEIEYSNDSTTSFEATGDHEFYFVL